MAIIDNANLIRMLLSHMQPEGEFSVESVPGDRNEVLFGLREMFQLGLITGEFEYAEVRDPVGPLFKSAESIRLTKRGICFK